VVAGIFLSYASPDKPAVLRIAAALRAAGHDPWLDDEILIGEPIAVAVERALRDADFVVICLSQAAAESGWVQGQRAPTVMQQLRERKARLLPVRLEDVRPPHFMATLKYVDLFPDEQALTDSVALLVRSIEARGASCRWVQAVGYSCATDEPCASRPAQ